ncbi:pseudouridine synthase family protein [secondary endosymbiont of Heteropsylla cubana]|uniref:Pseudouridine synthase n=1 Tax=secondary endosymbiont of Heteropsylla cubana TaxID=134287 RepID=J3TH06_9ENTR|nr:23S rRNA pseudouridine(2605) synthase RluB [secondary endosymbiont of Heteropsylla cubana]AFP85822.1 pseudouridine synthase family protein [secondary endosymbiont of Heteropsylla cubana]
MQKNERPQKVLARAGYGSRRTIEGLIEQGRVSVNRKIVTLGDRLNVTRTILIRIDKRLITIRPMKENLCRVLIYHKPAGEICTRYDLKNRKTVFNCLPPLQNAKWIAIGRLDINTSGLFLFTTNGELAHRLMHPSYAIEREYVVRVFGEINENKKRQLTCGVKLNDGLAAFLTLTPQGGDGLNRWYNVVLTEGRNREVRRLWEAVGMQVSRLIRVRYGNIILPKGLSPGSWIELPLAYINDLRKKVNLPLQESE